MGFCKRELSGVRVFLAIKKNLSTPLRHFQTYNLKLISLISSFISTLYIGTKLASIILKDVVKQFTNNG